MTPIIAVINQKGGIGKSTTALALAAGLKRNGFRVLSVDLDPQGNMTYAMAADPAGPTSLDMMLNGTDALLVIQQGDQGDIIPASTDLIRSNTLLNLPTREYRLRESLKPIRKAYDYIIDIHREMGVLFLHPKMEVPWQMMPKPNFCGPNSRLI